MASSLPLTRSCCACPHPFAATAAVSAAAVVVAAVYTCNKCLVSDVEGHFIGAACAAPSKTKEGGP